MSVQRVGSFGAAASSFELRQRNQREHMLTLQLLRKALEIRQVLVHGTQASQQRTFQGWTTQNVAASHELAHFGSAALANQNVPAVARNEQAQHLGVRPARQETGLEGLSAGDRSQGTTQALQSSERDALVHGEAVHAGAGSEAYTSRDYTHVAPCLKGKSTHKSDESGDVTVIIPAAKARSMGLLGPKEKDRDVFASLPKKVAQSLGLDNGPTSGAV